MANICSNIFYCSTDNDHNLEKLMYRLDEKFGFTELDGEDNSIRGTFALKWIFPETELERLMSELELDATLFIEVVSYKLGMGYFEAHMHGTSHLKYYGTIRFLQDEKCAVRRHIRF